MTIPQSLPITLQLGPIQLNVADLDRSVAWYERSLGLRLRSRGDRVAELGDGLRSSLGLHERPGAQPPADDDAAMFHYCLLYPTREELARAELRLEQTETPVTHMNDRHTHEAVYLDDPDGIHIELGWDRARELWPETPYGHPPVEIDLAGLQATVAGEAIPASVADGLRVGHVHFTVGSVEDAIAFYRDTLGFDLKYSVTTSVTYKAGAFFSVDGYHHHMAANVAKGAGVGPIPADSIGLRNWVIELADAAEVAATAARIERAGHELQPLERGFAVGDPWEIPVHVVS